jgi:hypothetical protein
MRKLLLACVILVGCKSDPLLEDMRMFCRAADVTHAKEAYEVFGYIADRMATDELKTLMFSVRDGTATLDEFLTNADALAKKAGVQPCETVKVLRRPRS